MQMDDPAVPAMAPGPRWMRVLLVLSLALNLLVAGAVLGLFLRGGPSAVVARDLGFGPFAAALSPEDRVALRRDWTARTQAEGEGRRAIRQDMRALLDSLRAEPFDPAATQAIMARGAGRMAGRLELGMSLIEERVLAFSTAERLAFADRLEQEMRRRPRLRETRREEGTAP